MKLILLYIRTLSRFKVYTVINIIGLALSLACVIIIFRYVKQENDVDCYSPDKDRIGIMAVSYTHLFLMLVTDLQDNDTI